VLRFIDEKHLPHLLFYGPPGTGKTTTILACARQLYGSTYKQMTLQLNASDDRGIDVVREQIKTFASTKTMFSSGFKLVVLDEADSMTQAAQSALRRIIEKYTTNVRFCLVCNYASKIIPAIQSRCTRFRFSPLHPDQILPRLQYVVQNEQVNVTEDGMETLIRLAKGDMRNVLNVLQACHAAFPVVDADAVYACTGQPHPADVDRVVHSCLNEDFSTAYNNTRRIQAEKGLALADLITELRQFVDGIELAKLARIYLLDQLSQVEYNVSKGASDNVQLAALIGAFKLAIELASRSNGSA
jgi:replication factor C subunit 3/5